MDPIKDLYQSWVREEIENPEVQNAREAFLNERFRAAPISSPSWGFVLSPSFRLAMVGCFALLVMVKTGAFDTVTPPIEQPVFESTQQLSVLPEAETKAMSVVPPVTTPSPNPVTRMSNIQIKKITSQVGATLAYQKHFPDAQITVLWVLPQGV